jgi:hypothetical protein
VIPQLRKLERKYVGKLVVVGVHSAKFSGEQDTAALRQAVMRLAVGHPVVNDRDFRVWQEYAVRAWPTLMFVDPRGKVIGRHEGEFQLEAMDQAIAEMVGEFEQDGSLDPRPISFTSELEREPDRPLFFPGKLLADPLADRLFVADTGHHRVLEVTLADGRVRRVFGSGQEGFADGSSSSAQFRGPQGLALAGDVLYVADTENHAIRRVDLTSGRVETAAGTGEQALRFQEGGAAREVPLSSPWDLVTYGDRLYVAMAGFHQIWELNLTRRTVFPWAGTGGEDLLDGPRRAALFAQPSGLAIDPSAGKLYVADSEASAVRAVDLGADGQVRTIVGQGLFDFGDQDGVGAAVRLQHPLGLALQDRLLYLADTYNHRIKRLDPHQATIASFFGSGAPGFEDGPAKQARFSEPAGITAARDCLYVADTNNHALRRCDLASGQVSTLQVRL